MTDVKSCKYCSLPESVTEPCLACSSCDCYAHISCLKSVSLPGGLLGDVFFKLTCDECSGNRIELVTRDKMSWLGVVVLVLYNLHRQTHGSSRRGYFHWKIHVCKFIQDKWKFLFAPNIKRKKTWMGTVSGTLTHYPAIFQSGLEQLGEAGWWRLHFPDLPPAQVLQLKSQGLLSAKKGHLSAIEGTGSEDTSVGSGSETVAEVKTEWSSTPDPGEMFSSAYVQPSATLSDMLFDEEEVDVEIQMLGAETLEPDSSQVAQTDTSFTHLPADLGHLVNMQSSHELVTKQEPYDSDESIERPPRASGVVAAPVASCRPLSQYEEVALLHRLQRAGPLPGPAARRLARKLAVRHTKRQRNLPLFNLDVSRTGYTDKDPSLGFSLSPEANRVLDRFQMMHHTNLAHPSFMLRLMGRVEPSCFHSPYTERLLKPYIFRDSSIRAPWQRLMGELLEKVNKVAPAPPAPLDYSYVRPQHIAPVNTLCREFFWPGIDLTESLQYPDFTCVALYKKLVVGFAFLVPDAGYNESYISFLFVRPEWRKAGIASFMLYHLIQTGMGKDVTLHVSATNPAVILYQKFGFKVEEFVQDFYEKYFPSDSRECRHALFLRLSR